MIKIIAFAGRKQSGKTSCCQFVQEQFDIANQSATVLVSDHAIHNHNRASHIYNFADPLKKMCMEILGLSYQQCYGSDEEKNELVNCIWSESGERMSAREVMQYLGTDIFRKMQHNVWADATIRKIQNDNIPLSLIADCRFPNEVEAVKSAGGLVIKLNRNLYNSQHDSETALDEDRYDNSKFDLIIDNRSLQISETHQLVLNYLQMKKVL